MMAYRKIICGVTGSTHAQKAALEAAELAKRNQADLVYVYAVDLDFLRGGKTQQESVEKSLEKLGRTILDHAEELARTRGVTPKKVLRKGNVFEVLRDVMIEERGDLLVLGHEKRSAFEKILVKGAVEDHIEELKLATGADVNVIT